MLLAMSDFLSSLNELADLFYRRELELLLQLAFFAVKTTVNHTFHHLPLSIGHPLHCFRKPRDVLISFLAHRSSRSFLNSKLNFSSFCGTMFLMPKGKERSVVLLTNLLTLPALLLLGRNSGAKALKTGV